MKSLLLLCALLALALAAPALAQRPRSVANESEKPSAPVPAPPPAPMTFAAKYEGGVFGYNKKMNGTLTFDDINNRLLFRDKKNKELFSIPYASLTGAYGDTHSVQPKSATIASHVPYIGIPAQFVKTKVQYLTLQYNDPDSNAAGITSFKVADKKLMDSVLTTLAGKAGLIPRGQIFVRKK